MRKWIGCLLIVGALLLTMLSSTVQAQTTDEQALGIAQQAVKSLSQGSYDAVYDLFDEAMQKALSKDQLKGAWESLVKSQGEYQSEIGHTVSTVQGFKVVVLTTQFKNVALAFTISITDKGKIGGLFFRPVAAPKAELASDEQEVSFKSGEDTFYGTLLIPANAKGKVPAALLISGSGPTDRDGNSTLLQGKIDSHKTFARILAEAGIASLRYDKYGTGKTGMASFASKPTSLTFDVYIDAAVAGYNYLGNRAEVDPTHLAILGHSEGGLIALLAAERLKATTMPATTLMLVAPVSKPYLVTVREQIATQYANAVKGGQFTQQQADEGMAELDRIIAQVSKDGTLPDKISPQYTQLFAPSTVKFLQNVSQYDPAKVAAGLPPTLKVLILCGQKDQQVPCDVVQSLVDGFKNGGNTNVQFNKLNNVNHVFKEIEGTPNLQTDYTDPGKPFSREAKDLIVEFVRLALLR